MTTTTDIPEGFHRDPKGDNCKVKIEGVYVPVSVLAKLYQAAWIECVESRCCGSMKNVAHAREVHDAVRRGSGIDDAHREAGLEGGS